MSVYICTLVYVVELVGVVEGVWFEMIDGEWLVRAKVSSVSVWVSD